MANFIERPRYTCALGGALGTITALPEAIPILHVAQGCAGNAVWTQNGGSALQVGGYCGGLTVPSSNIHEREVVFGGVERLREQITTTLQMMEGRLYFVITGCVTDIIGDDVKAVVNRFQQDGVTIIHAETGGFKGNSYAGYDLVLQSLFRNYVQPGQETVARRVNLWGIVPFMDVFWRGNLEAIRVLLEKLGLSVNTFFTAADTLDSLEQAGNAELNIVLSPTYGVEAARVFQEVHGTPYQIAVPPIGPTATATFLRQTAAALQIETSTVERVIADEGRRYYHYLETLTDCYNDLDLQRFAIVVGDANYSAALTNFLSDDLGWLPEFVVCTDQLTPAEQSQVAAAVKPETSTPRLVFETDTGEVIRHFKLGWPEFRGQKYYNAFSPAFVLGSSLDRQLALDIGAAHLSVSFPVANRAIIDRGYLGYQGGLRLIEDLFSSVVAGR